MIEYYIAAGIIILLFTTKKKAGEGFVDVGTPNVSGPGSDEFGGTDYGTETAMQRLIRESNSLGETVMRDGQTGLASPDDSDIIW